MKTLSKYMLATAVTFAISGVLFISCGQTGSGKAAATNQDAISGKVVDGYIKNATVYLDLDKDGELDQDEPRTSTDATGSYTMNISDTHKSHSNYNTASIVAYGGTDMDSNQEFKGQLKATNIGSATVNITPVTTLVDSMSLPYTESKNKIAEILGVSADDIEKDPIISNNTKLFAKAAAVQRAVDLLIKADDSSDTNAKKANNIMEALAKGLKNQTGEKAIEEIISSIDTSSINNKSANVVKLAQQLAKQTWATYTNINDRANWAKTCDIYLQDTYSIIADNNLSIELPYATVEAFKERNEQKEHFNATINGTVKDSGGTAYANRTVFLRDNVATGNGNGGFYTTQTDDSGNYSFKVFTKGTYTLWLSLTEDEEQTAPAQGKGIVFYETGEITTAGSVTTMDFVVKKLTSSNTSPYTITPPVKAIFYGKMFADTNNDGLYTKGEYIYKNASIMIRNVETGERSLETTDEYGTYKFAMRYTGRFVVWYIIHTDYKYRRADNTDSKLDNFEFIVNDGDNKVINLPINSKEYITLSGRMYYDDNHNESFDEGIDRPVKNREWYMIGTGENVEDIYIKTHTDINGKYTFKVEKGKSWKLRKTNGTYYDVIKSPVLENSLYYDFGVINDSASLDIRLAGYNDPEVFLPLVVKVHRDHKENHPTGSIINNVTGTGSPQKNFTIHFENDRDKSIKYDLTTGEHGEIAFEVGKTGGIISGIYTYWYDLPEGAYDSYHSARLFGSESCDDQDGILPDMWSSGPNCTGTIYRKEHFYPKGHYYDQHDIMWIRYFINN